MTVSLLASRYARALFELSAEHNVADQVEAELATSAELLCSAEFSAVLFHPKVERQARKDLLARAFADCHVLVQDFLQLLVDKGRERALPQISREYSALAAARRGELKAQVTSAVPLLEAEVERLRVRLGQDVHSVVIEQKIDDALMGGMIIRIGNKIYDGSLLTRIRSLQRRFSQAK